jgi:hypothetical protein
MEHADCPETASAERYAMKRLDPFARIASELQLSDEFSPLLESDELGPLEVELLLSG